MRISDWSSDVCSSDLKHDARDAAAAVPREIARDLGAAHRMRDDGHALEVQPVDDGRDIVRQRIMVIAASRIGRTAVPAPVRGDGAIALARSEEHTSELPSLTRTSYAVFRLKQK